MNSCIRQSDFIVVNKTLYKYNYGTNEWDYCHMDILDYPRNLVNLDILEKYKNGLTRYITFIDNDLLYDRSTYKLRKIEKNDYIIYKKNIRLNYNNRNKYIKCKIFRKLKSYFNEGKDILIFIKYIYSLIGQSIDKNQKKILFLDIGGIFIKSIFLELFQDMYYISNLNDIAESLFVLYIINGNDDVRQLNMILSDINIQERKWPIVVFNNTSVSLTLQHSLYYDLINRNKNIDIIRFNKTPKPIDSRFTPEIIKICIYNKVINKFQ